MTATPRSGLMKVDFEPPDTITVQFVGIVNAEIVKQARREAYPLIGSLSHYIMIFDVRQLESLSSEGRRAMVANAPPGTPPARAIAVVGASFHTRAIMTMLARAWQFFHPQDDRPVQFFDSLDDARRWLGVRRAKLKSPQSE